MNLQQPFKLRGSGIDDYWKQVTNNAWRRMLPENWEDKGFHFYSRIRERGPIDGIPNPNHLESEIMKGTVSKEGTPNRFQITLMIANSKGQKLRVIYDYSASTKVCSLVTLSY